MPEDKIAFDVSHPSRVGADPNSRPVIPPVHPITSDPMVRQPDPNQPKKIEIKDQFSGLGSQESNYKSPASFNPAPPKPRSTPIAILDGEPLSSPSYQKSYSTVSGSSPKKSPHMPVSVLTGIASNVPASSLVDAKSVDNGPSKSTGKVVSGHDNIKGMSDKKSSRRWIMRTLVVLIILIISAYLVLDSQVIKNNINLPFHVFGSSSQADTNSSGTTANSAPTLPAGFSKYNLSGTNVTFAAPSAWGVPTVATDDGFTKRGGNNASDGKYAYLTAFPNNQEVTMVFSSSKYLPPARTAVYYDFLQWCVGTNDGNYYQTAMRFTTAGGVDSPATVACDQGPLANVTKIDSTTIVQKAAKTTDGKDFGDLYTKNLSDKNIAVVRVRDSTMKNADNITSILSNITFSSSAQ